MGCGKTSAFKFLSKYYNCFDLDQLIQIITGKRIDQIFTLYKERSFREFEIFIFQNLLFNDNIIISLGGGTLSSVNSLIELKNKNKIIFLYTPLNILWERVRSSGRPKVTNFDQFERLYFQRLPIYFNYCDFIIDSSDKSWKQKMLNYIKLQNLPYKKDSSFGEKVVKEIRYRFLNKFT